MLHRRGFLAGLTVLAATGAHAAGVTPELSNT